MPLIISRPARRRTRAYATASPASPHDRCQSGFDVVKIVSQIACAAALLTFAPVSHAAPSAPSRPCAGAALDDGWRPDGSLAAPTVTPPADGSVAAPGSLCWTDVQPYPFGRDGEPVDESSSACRLSVAGAAQACYLTVTSFAFRAPNRGLAAATNLGDTVPEHHALRRLALQRRTLVPRPDLSRQARLPRRHRAVGGQARLLADRPLAVRRCALAEPLPLRRSELRVAAARAADGDAQPRHAARRDAAARSDHLRRLQGLERLLVLRLVRHARALGRHGAERRLGGPGRAVARLRDRGRAGAHRLRGERLRPRARRGEPEQRRDGRRARRSWPRRPTAAWRRRRSRTRGGLDVAALHAADGAAGG